MPGRYKHKNREIGCQATAIILAREVAVEVARSWVCGVVFRQK